MDPPLRERVSLRGSTGPVPDAQAWRAEMARTGAVWGAAAALFALIAALIPDARVHDQDLLLVVAGVSLVFPLLFVLAYDRLPLWAFHAAAVVGTVVLSAAVYAWGTESAYAPLPYLWLALGVFYYFSLPVALAHLVLIALGYAGALALESPSGNPLDGWIATVGTLLLVGVFISVVRDRLSAVIASLSDAARRDPLTDLLNRRGFEEAFDIELERARRAGAPLSLVVGDIDRFKRVNDEFGHATGDEALRRIASMAQLLKRGFDTAARIGGEEFALLVPDSDEHGAYMLAERIRAEVERSFGSAGRPPLTVSFGIATFPLHGQSSDALLRAADQALYAAKRLGRNRAVISSAEVPGILARPPRGSEEAHVELATLLSLAEALDLRDAGTADHCQTVGRHAELTARELGLAPTLVERVRLAGVLHDIGKIGLSDAILGKPGPLDEDEWTEMRRHPEIGARILAAGEFDDIRAWVVAHHERPDGRGYPHGLHDEEIPLEAKILAVADAYEAMTSDRVYRAAIGRDAARAELRRGAGGQFDARVVRAFLAVLDRASDALTLRS
jgi:diguanylate cyclase (GGDEF)-like protein/putative nucleotidyltransferase with HDIG domain